MLSGGFLEVSDGGSTSGTVVKFDGNGNSDTIAGFAAGQFLGIAGNDDRLTAGPGAATLIVDGDNDTAIAGSGPDTIWATGNGVSIQGGGGDDTIYLLGTGDSVDGGSGSDQIFVGGDDDTVGAGAGSATIYLGGSGETVADSGAPFADTVIGFNNGAGDAIKLGGGDTPASAVAHSTQVNGTDTLVLLGDGSTILLKGITGITTGFFS